jgi:hypothetical protein
MITVGKAKVNGRNRGLYKNATSSNSARKKKGGDPKKNPVSAFQSYLNPAKCEFSPKAKRKIKIGTLFDSALYELLLKAHNWEKLKMIDTLVTCNFNIVNENNQNIIKTEHEQLTPQPEFYIDYRNYSDDVFIDGYVQYLNIKIPKYKNDENISIANKCSQLTIKQVKRKLEEFKNNYINIYKPLRIFETVPNSSKLAYFFLNKQYVVQIEIAEYDNTEYHEICFEFGMGYIEREKIKKSHKMYNLLRNFMDKSYVWKETYNDDLDKIMLQTFITDKKQPNRKPDHLISLTKEPFLVKHIFDLAKKPEVTYNMIRLSKLVMNEMRLNPKPKP